MDFSVSMIDVTMIERSAMPHKHDDKPGFLRRHRTPLMLYVVVVLLTVYALHVPLPHNFGGQQRHLMHAMDVALQFAYARPVKLMAALGVSSVTTTMHVRYVLDTAAKALGPWGSDHRLNIHDTHIAGVPVRVYEPSNEIGGRANDGMLVFVHGGGFVVGEVDAYDCLVRTLTRQLRMVVVSVEYRRAPEHVYPSAHDDVESVIVALLSHAHRRFGVDPKRIVMAGDSAGGNLVAVTTQRLRRLNDMAPTLPKIKAQVLFYPLTQFHHYALPSYVEYEDTLAGTAFLDPQLVVKAYLLYMGVHAEESSVQTLLSGRRWHGSALLHQFAHLDALFDTPADYAPLLADDLSRLPKAFVATAQYDILRTEGALYAHALRDAGVAVTLVNYETGFHAMLNFYRHLSVAQRLIADASQWILANV